MSSVLMRLLGPLVYQEALHWRDAEGRPLGEQASPVFYAAAGADERPCPYADTRHGRVMNRSALHQIRQHWDDILATVSHLGACIVPADQPVTLHHAWAINAAANGLVIFLRLTQASAPVPVPMAALYKVSLGFTKVLPDLLLADPDHASRPLETLFSPSDFFAHLDDGRLLIGRTQVCAGSRAQVMQYYTALLRPALQTDGPPIGPWTPSVAAFSVLTRELFTLVAVWTATVGALLMRAPPARAPHQTWPTGHRVYRQLRSPAVNMVRGQRHLDPVQVTWLYPDGQYPASVIRFLERVDIHHASPVDAADQLFLTEARDVVARLLDVLALPPLADALTLPMFEPRQGD